VNGAAPPPPTQARCASMASLWLPLVAGLAQLGCGKLLGVDDYAVGPSSVDAATKIQFKDAECDACMQKSCIPELEACEHDASCNVWERQIAACKPAGDGTCEHAAFANLTATNGTMGNVSACTFEHCYDACRAGACANAPSSTCGDKIRATTSEPAFRACSEDPRCLKFTRCMFEQDCVLRANPGCFWRCSDLTREYEPTITDGGFEASKIAVARGRRPSLCFATGRVRRGCRRARACRRP
jgi:hypothetical protein